MKKKIKIFLILSFFLFFTSNIISADFIKPDTELKPFDVVKIQLIALKNNNNPYKDAGIEQTWEFAHPSNKSVTGPLPRFIELLNDDSYSILLNHLEHKIVEIFKTDNKFIYEVTVLDKEKKIFKYNWQVEKFINNGPLNNCWLTTSVSLPKLLGNSI